MSRFVTRWIDGKGWVPARPVRNCRHPKSKRMRLNHSDWDCCYDCNICRVCGEWLSLGESNDNGVSHEIRAAEIAANHDSSKPPIEWCNIYEWFGFDAPEDGAVYRMSKNDWTAGWLARQIVKHGEAGEG